MHNTYRADIDGLRAVAVTAVLLFHADLGCDGGYVGVDVFFVISGFLITSLILKDIDRGRFQVVDFVERRVRRILPPLAVVVFASLVAGWLLLFPLELQELGQSVFAQAMLVSNVYFWLESGYFAEAAEVKPLLHTWSLAVEEQFYLLFPVLLVLINRVSRKLIIPSLLLIGGASFGFSVYSSYTYPSFNFYLLPTRAWELLMGSLLAAIPMRHFSSRWLTESLSWTGFVAIIGAIVLFDRETRFPGVAALLPCVGTSLVIWANGQSMTYLGRWLSTPPLVFVGLISYSLYLWHWPVFVFAKYWTLGTLSLNERLLLLVLSVALAILSWKCVEGPFRQRKIFAGRVQIVSFASVATVTLLLAGLVLHACKGVPSRIPTEALQYANAKADFPFLCQISLMQARNGELVELGSENKHSPIDLLVWGDSHAMAALPILDIMCRENSIRGVAATHSATSPLVGYEDSSRDSLKGDSLAFKETVVEFVSMQHVSNVLLIARWDHYIASDQGTDRLRSYLEPTIKNLTESGANVWIMRQVPKQRCNVPQSLASAVLYGRDLEELALPFDVFRRDFQLQDPLFEGLSRKYVGVTVLDPTDVFYVAGTTRCRIAEGGRSLYCDGDHLSSAGALLLRPLFEPVFVEIDRGRSLDDGENTAD